MFHGLAVRRCLPELMVENAILLMGRTTEIPTVGNGGNNRTDSNGNPPHNSERGNANLRTSPGKTNPRAANNNQPRDSTLPRVGDHLVVDSHRMLTTDTVDGN